MTKQKKQEQECIIKVLEPLKQITPSVTPSPREIELLNLIRAGYSSEMIKEELHISKFTVDTHRKTIIKKLNAKNMAHAMAIAFDKGILKLKCSDE